MILDSSRYVGVEGHIGHTPLLRLRRLSELTGCEILGKAEFMNPGGSVVEAVLQFDSGKSRLTVEEAKTLRDAIVKTREGEGISINFDLVAHSLLSSGKMKEALAAYRQLVKLRPIDKLPVGCATVQSGGYQPPRRMPSCPTSRRNLQSGQARVNGNGHLVQASQGERGRQAEVEGTGATMQRAVDVPGRDPLALAELACGREAA